MAEPFMGEVRVFAFNFPPRNWAFCNGQTLPINQNQALFSLLGTMYGGDGIHTFALPNLQARTAMHRNQTFPQGGTGGQQQHTLVSQEMPGHTHALAVSGAGGDQTSPATHYLAAARGSLGSTYAPASSPLNSPLAPAAILPNGGSQPHNNMSPFLVVNFCIALSGIFPSRN